MKITLCTLQLTINLYDWGESGADSLHHTWVLHTDTKKQQQLTKKLSAKIIYIVLYACMHNNLVER